MTATEVRMRVDEWERVNQPRYEAAIARFFCALLPKTFGLIAAYLLDAETQQQRMTDDGCPL